MKFIKSCGILLSILIFSSCACTYKKVAPETLNFNSMSLVDGVSLEYKYDVLTKKYKKKELKNNIKVVAVRIKNMGVKDLVIGVNLKLVYENGNEISILDPTLTYKALKQHPATHLFYLLLAPLNGYATTTTNSSYQNTQSQGDSFPIGLIIGPGLAGGNMLVSSNANKKFKRELYDLNLSGKVIKQGATVNGLIAINSDSHNPIKIKLE